MPDPDSPDIAAIGALIGDRARAAMLVSLMDGRALTATELARAARITKQTASSHLAKLTHARLIDATRTGRHRYFRLAGHDVGTVIEDLIGLARRTGVTHVDPGPADPSLRKARVCYDHLAGDLGVQLFDRLAERRLIRVAGRTVSLTTEGGSFLERQKIDVASLQRGRRPLCLSCLDWSVRRPHLAGAVGAALFDLFLSSGWARRSRNSRTVVFSSIGERSFNRLLGSG